MPNTPRPPLEEQLEDTGKTIAGQEEIIKLMKKRFFLERFEDDDQQTFTQV